MPTLWRAYSILHFSCKTELFSTLPYRGSLISYWKSFSVFVFWLLLTFFITQSLVLNNKNGLFSPHFDSNFFSQWVLCRYIFLLILKWYIFLPNVRIVNDILLFNSSIPYGCIFMLNSSIVNGWFLILKPYNNSNNLMFIWPSNQIPALGCFSMICGKRNMNKIKLYINNIIITDIKNHWNDCELTESSQ